MIVCVTSQVVKSQVHSDAKESRGVWLLCDRPPKNDTVKYSNIKYLTSDKQYV